MPVRVIRGSDSLTEPVEYAVSEDELQRRIYAYKRKYNTTDVQEE